MTKDRWRPAYIGIGSNLDQPIEQVKQATQHIKMIPESKFIKISPLYESSPLGPTSQPNFINAVAAIMTCLSAHNLLNELKEIEVKQKRTRNVEKWGPRIIDLDLLVFSSQTINDKRLTVPHPEIKYRDFVLKPMSDITLDLKIPGLDNVEDLLKKIENNSIMIKRLD